MFTTPIHTNQQSIDRVLGAGLPVMLVFGRKDTDASRQLEPMLISLAAAYAGQALIARIDAQDNPALLQRYTITQLPGFAFIKDGKPVAQWSGAISEDVLRSWLDYLAKGGARPPLPAVSSNGYTSQSRPSAQASGQAAASTQAPTVLSDTTFDKTISASAQPVLVDFWAPWCGPCRTVAPSVERIAQEFASRAVVAKLNIDDNPRTAQRFGISSIPALYIFKGGKVVERLVGAQPIEALRQALARHSGG